MQKGGEKTKPKCPRQADGRAATKKMILKDVLSAALTYVGADADILNEEDCMQDDDVRLMVKCTGFAMDEIASEYLQAVHCESVVSSGKKLDYADFTKQPLRVKKVSRDGKSVRFKARASYAEVDEDGVFEVEYTYLPEHPSLLTDSVQTPLPVPVKSLALGAAAQYCLITGRYEQSVALSDMFAEDMRTQARPYKAFKWKR